MNKDIEKIVGKPLNVTNGDHTRSDNDASKTPKTRSLGKGNFLPDTQRLGYGSEGVTPTGGCTNGPSGRT